MRLREARKAAGFATGQDAASRFGWNYPTYAGHENGSRGMRADALRVYARAFKVDALWLMDGAGRGPDKKTGSVVNAENVAVSGPGFNDQAISPYVATRPGQAKLISSLAAELTPGLRHRQIFTVNRAYHAFAVLAGDVIVIGTPERSFAGDVVVTTLALPGLDDPQTVLRQCVGDVVIAPVGDALADEANRSVGILGTVAAVIRPPHLLPG
jgi:transcriptional regulator with XRE-family HTH domain